MPPRALFPALLGDADWALLAPPVQRMHGDAGLLIAHGEAQVDGAHHWPARLLRRVLRLPEPGTRQGLRVTIQRDARGETWTREFARGRMRSTLRQHDRAQLREQLGPISLHFSLHRDGEAIDWRLQRVHLLGLPLPRALAGQVLSRSGARHGRYAFTIDARLPLLGRLVSYDGWLEIDDGD